MAAKSRIIERTMIHYHTQAKCTRIRRAVQQAHLPQRFLAAKLGIHHRILEKYISGEVKPHPLKELILINAIIEIGKNSHSVETTQL